MYIRRQSKIMTQINVSNRNIKALYENSKFKDNSLYKWPNFVKIDKAIRKIYYRMLKCA